MREARRRREDVRLYIAAGNLDLTTADPGDSIAVSGVCLTVVELHGDGFSADVSAETQRCTTFAALQAGDRVNLEKALTLAAPLGGHMVSGHVDGIAEVQARAEEGQSVCYRIKAPRPLRKYIAAKGSVCIDGVSLTVNAVDGEVFAVNIVPYTLQETTLGSFAPGQRVNLEVDLIARYIERLLLDDRAAVRGGRLSRELLAQYGFIDE